MGPDEVLEVHDAGGAADDAGDGAALPVEPDVSPRRRRSHAALPP